MGFSHHNRPVCFQGLQRAFRREVISFADRGRSYAFYNGDLEEFTIPSTVTKIGGGVFENNENLVKITIYNKTCNIGWDSMEKSGSTQEGY